MPRPFHHIAWSPRSIHPFACALALIATGCVIPMDDTTTPPTDDTDLTCRCQEDAQVSIEVRFLSVSDSFLEDIGIDVATVFDSADGEPTGASYGPAPLSDNTASFLSTLDPSADLVLPPLNPPADDLADGLSPIGSLITQSDVDLIINSLTDDATLLTAPTITTRFGQSAFATILNESQTLDDLDADFKTRLRSIDELINPVTVGPALEVTPRVDADGTIIVDIRPSTGGVFHTPETADGRVQTRGSRVVTTVRVQDGETLLLTGVTDDSGTTAEGTIPLLANVPLIGRSFDNQAFVTAQTNLLIMVTPTIVVASDDDS